MSDQHASPGIDASVIWLSWVRDREPSEASRSSKEIQMTERMTLPVLPLRDFVLLPGVTAPINAGKPATLRAIEAALNTPERLVFAVSQREDVQQVTPEVLHTIGTVARIGQLQRGLAGVQRPVPRVAGTGGGAGYQVRPAGRSRPAGPGGRG